MSAKKKPTIDIEQPSPETTLPEIKSPSHQMLELPTHSEEIEDSEKIEFYNILYMHCEALGLHSDVVLVETGLIDPHGDEARGRIFRKHLENFTRQRSLVDSADLRKDVLSDIWAHRLVVLRGMMAALTQYAKDKNDGTLRAHYASKTFNEALIYRRKLCGLSQEQLAFRSGITASQISKLERGVMEPMLSTILALAKGLSINPCELLPKPA